MAKTITTIKSLYNVTADVVVKSNVGIEVVIFDCGGFTTKSVRALKKSIHESYESDGFEVLAIDNIQTNKVTTKTSYRIDASAQEIIDACIAAGLDVTFAE